MNVVNEIGKMLDGYRTNTDIKDKEMQKAIVVAEEFEKKMEQKGA